MQINENIGTLTKRIGMNLNQIQLSPYQIADLYAQVLMEHPAPALSPSQSFNYLGGNARHVLIMVDKPHESFLPENELQFLNSILSACKLTIADVAIVNRAHLSVSFAEVLSILGSTIVLLFDITPQTIDLPVFFPHYQVQSFNGRMYLSAPTLSLIADDKAQKTLLWTSLRKLFGL